MLAMIVSCSRSAPEQPANQLPAAPASPAATSSGAYEVTTVADGGSIAGTIMVSGSVQKLPQRKIAKDPQVCGTAPRDSQKLMVGKSGGLQNAVVIVEGVKRGKAMPTTAQSAEIDQSKCEYSPHVQVMAVNSEISLKNNDPILHNVQFFEGENSLFNIAQPVQGQVNKHKIEKTGALYVECAVHGWMQANVVVVDNPYYAVTDENGKFSIADLPPGTYHVKVFHEYLGEMASDVTVPSKGSATLDMDFKDLLAKKAAPSASPGASTVAANTQAGGNEVIVQMREITGEGVEAGTFRFEPATLTIKAGTTIKWVNNSGEDGPRHTSTDDPAWDTPQSPAVLPVADAKWRTPFLRPGESATHTFTVPGKYQYFCETHGQYGMIGTITVTP
jgi:plastocyanin